MKEWRSFSLLSRDGGGTKPTSLFIFISCLPGFPPSLPPNSDYSSLCIHYTHQYQVQNMVLELAKHVLSTKVARSLVAGYSPALTIDLELLDLQET